jgi:hypothetical protein
MFETMTFAKRTVSARAPFRGLGLAAVVLWCATGHALAVETPAPAPIKIAVFPFELEDFSAAGQEGSAPDETSFLAQSTEEAKQQLAQSGRYVVVDTAGADVVPAKTHELRDCGGCEAPAALKLGADQALVGVVTKISMTEYTVRFQVRDARTGTVLSSLFTDLRMGADYSWSRGVRWLMQNRLLASH